MTHFKIKTEQLRCNARKLFLLYLTLLALGLPAQGRAQEVETKKPAADAEKIAPGFELKALADFRKMMPFKSIDNPVMIKANEALFMEDADYVLAFTEQGQSRAYPLKIAWFHHVINDKMTDAKGVDTFFAISYCSVCNTGIRYEPFVDGKKIMLDFYGLYNGVVTLCDRDTETVWLQADGTAAKGARVGAKLKSKPLLNITWWRWKALHPDTLVMSQETEFKKYYHPDKRGYVDLPKMFFPTITRTDPRLPFAEMILAVAIPLELRTKAEGKIVGKESANPETKETTVRNVRAYPLKSLKSEADVVNDLLDETPLVVFFDEEADTAAAYSRVVEAKTLTFESRKLPSGKLFFYDKETGSRWNIEGKAEEGPLAGKLLTNVESHLSEWYGWVAYFPQTSIYGKTDLPNTQKFVQPK